MNLGWISGTVNVPIDVQCKTPKKKAHSEKSMNVSDVQVSARMVSVGQSITTPAT